MPGELAKCAGKGDGGRGVRVGGAIPIIKPKGEQKNPPRIIKETPLVSIGSVTYLHTRRIRREERGKVGLISTSVIAKKKPTRVRLSVGRKMRS